MAIPKKTPTKVDDFIGGAVATAADAKKKPTPASKYLLSIDKKLRDQIRIEAIGRGVSMSEYICEILKQRPK